MKNLYIGGGRVMRIKREAQLDGHVVFAYREVFFSKAFGWLKSKFARKEKDNKAVAFNYMKQEAKKRGPPCIWDISMNGLQIARITKLTA